MRERENLERLAKLGRIEPRRKLPPGIRAAEVKIVLFIFARCTTHLRGIGYALVAVVPVYGI